MDALEVSQVEYCYASLSLHFNEHLLSVETALSFGPTPLFL